MSKKQIRKVSSFGLNLLNDENLLKASHLSYKKLSLIVIQVEAIRYQITISVLHNVLIFLATENHLLGLIRHVSNSCRDRWLGPRF